VRDFAVRDVVARDLVVRLCFIAVSCPSLLISTCIEFRRISFKAVTELLELLGVDLHILTKCHSDPMDGMFMPETNQRDVAESVFERNQRRETEINQALQQEQARRAAVVANMHRLRQLRLQRDAKSGQ